MSKKEKIVELTETLIGCLNPGGVLRPEAWTGVDEVLRPNGDGTVSVYAVGVVEREVELEKAA